MPANADHAQELCRRIDGCSHHWVFCTQHHALGIRYKLSRLNMRSAAGYLAEMRCWRNILRGIGPLA